MNFLKSKFHQKFGPFAAERATFWFFFAMSTFNWLTRNRKNLKIPIRESPTSAPGMKKKFNAKQKYFTLIMCSSFKLIK